LEFLVRKQTIWQLCKGREIESGHDPLR
jgi:hypothetical protein